MSLLYTTQSCKSQHSHCTHTDQYVELYHWVHRWNCLISFHCCYVWRTLHRVCCLIALKLHCDVDLLYFSRNFQRTLLWSSLLSLFSFVPMSAMVELDLQ